MKFMKLGSKPDQFQDDGDNIRLSIVTLFNSFFYTAYNVLSDAGRDGC